MNIEDRLESIRSEMGRIAEEAKDRAHESSDTANHHLRMFYMIASLAEALRVVTWAVKRQINPHEDQR